MDIKVEKFGIYNQEGVVQLEAKLNELAKVGRIISVLSGELTYTVILETFYHSEVKRD